MKLNKKVVGSVVVAGLAGMLTITAVTSSEKPAETEVAQANNLEQAPVAGAKSLVAVNTSLENDGLAGVSATLYSYRETAVEAADNKLLVEDENAEIVSAAQDEELVTKEPELTPEQKEWQDKLMAKVDESLNVRAKADEKSDVVGKLYKGDRAKIVKVGKTWTKIESGNVKGYVKNEYCLTGDDALKYAKKTCDTVAKVTIDGLRIRSEASTDASVVDAVASGTKLVVDKKAKTNDEWVAVKYESKTCYVSAEYVKISLNTGKAITIEEEQKAKEAAEAAKQDNSSSSSSSDSGVRKPKTENGSSVAANTDDTTLLAAIIMCEAGGESYQCQLGIGAVVCNRVKSGHYPNSIYKVIYQRGQFGPASSGKLARVLKNKSISGTAKRAARAALSGQDNTNGAIGFRLYRKGLKGVKIGRVLFFK